MPDETPSPRPWRALHLLLGLAAGLWIWLQPQGFPASHPRFWANLAAPALVLALALAALAHKRLWRGLAFAELGLLLGGIASALLTFPQTAHRPALAAALLAALLLVALWRSFGAPQTWGRGPILALAIGALVGAAGPPSQRADPPSTRPLGGALPTLSGPAAPGVIALGEGARWHPRGTLELDVPGGRVRVDPTLSFFQRSPDAGWIAFTPAADRNLQRAPFSAQPSPAGLLAVAEPRPGLAPERHSIRAVRDGRGLTIEALAELPAPVFSHVNSWAQVELWGEDLGLKIADIPARFALEPSDYPIGRPVQFACWGPGEVLRVLRARSGEKGPYTELARAPLARGAPLRLTLTSGERAFAVIRFEDFTAQASQDLSPTAGWGVPVNAIIFTLAGSGRGHISLTLADTGIGRGFDSVGHSAGVTRNRIRIEPLD